MSGPFVLITGATRGIGAAAVGEHVADVLGVSEERRLARDVLDGHQRIDVLANNAGAKFTSRQVTEDGFERTFALNPAAGLLLTELLRERLAGGRVVMT